ncbi:hypothetical protein [Streptomyces sp. NPDC001410]|uniref:hypothetical protein n=1 Tax=Streptomyces sp. NPDC001410 TaxID=3364574 RepID=UPI003688B6EB
MPVRDVAVVDDLVGPSARGRASLAGLPVVAITRAPRSVANCTVNSDTPPDPVAGTVARR